MGRPVTETHVYGTDQAEATVWDTAGSIVWGPRQGPAPDPPSGPYPATSDPMVQRLRPPVGSLTNVYLVDPSTPDAYQTINAAFSAVSQGRDAQGIRGSGPQDFALVLVAPGEYEERLRPPDWTALVSTTGNPDDVRVWWDFEVGPTHGPVLNPTGPCYIEGIHFDGIGHYEGDPGAGNAPATIWLVNGSVGSTVTLVNVRSTSDNEWLNTGAFQCGDASTVMAYRTEFRMSDGSQPMNVQTSQAWRSMNPEHRSEYLYVDCEASCPEGLVVGLADLRHGAYDRLAWTGGTIHQAPGNTAQFFHAAFLDTWQGPHNCETFCSPQVTYAGDGVSHTWGEPSDLEDSIPDGGVARTSRAVFYPQALDKVGTLATAAPDSTMTMQAGRWYFAPLEVPEARTLAGFSLDVVSGAAGTLRAALWEGPLRNAEFFNADAQQVAPQKWVSLGASASITPGPVDIGRGSYKRTRIYPGPQMWVGVMADSACTVRASSTLTASGLAMFQDLPTVPATPDPTPLTGSPVPAPVVRTGIV